MKTNKVMKTMVAGIPVYVVDDRDNSGTILEGYETDCLAWSGCQIKCPKCQYWSAEGMWRKGDVHCEDCGSHEAICCPECDEWFDSVYSDHWLFLIR